MKIDLDEVINTVVPIFIVAVAVVVFLLLVVVIIGLIWPQLVPGMYYHYNDLHLTQKEWLQR